MMLTRKKIEEKLLGIGVPAGVSGFKFITDAILLFDKPEWKKPKFIALYDKIGEMNGSTGGRVERAIRHALESARKNGNNETVYYLGMENRCISSTLKMLYTRMKNEDEVAEDPREEAHLRRLIREEIRAMLKGVI